MRVYGKLWILPLMLWEVIVIWSMFLSDGLNLFFSAYTRSGRHLVS